MRTGHHPYLLAALMYVLPLAAQGLQHGDVLVVGERETVDSEGTRFFESNIRVHGRDGALERELFSTWRFLTEPLYRDGIVYVGQRAPDAINRIDSSGNLLTPFTTQVYAINYLSPGPGGGLFAANGSGEIYQFAADGTLLRFRDFTHHPRATGGIDLAADQCVVFYGASGSLARWDSCLDTPAGFFAPDLAAASRALRLLPDGTFLHAVIGLQPNLGNRIIHADRNGDLIRSYPIPGKALALDIDGSTFWTNSGNFLLRVNIATGELVSVTHTDSVIIGISVVGEPRAGFAAASGPAPIPALSPSIAVILALLLSGMALMRLRA